MAYIFYFIALERADPSSCICVPASLTHTFLSRDSSQECYRLLLKSLQPRGVLSSQHWSVFHAVERPRLGQQTQLLSKSSCFRAYNLQCSLSYFFYIYIPLLFKFLKKKMNLFMLRVMYCISRLLNVFFTNVSLIDVSQHKEFKIFFIHTNALFGFLLENMYLDVRRSFGSFLGTSLQKHPSVS